MEKKLDNVTLMCLNCVDPSLGVKALRYSMQGIDYARVVLFSHIKPDNITDDIEFIKIPKLTHHGSCWFMFKQIYNYINTNFCLSIHDDGFVINPQLWLDEFLEYDYIGAPWAGGQVGNGGFTLRSKLFIDICQLVPWNGEHDDWHACITHKDFYTSKGCKFAPTELAVKFSLEGMIKGYDYDLNKCFGFHGKGETEYLFGDKGQQFKDKIALLNTIN
jgi:hypothetical protein